MAKFRDITGQKFGRWSVLSYVETRYAEKFWKCICECGTEKVVIGSSLKMGRSKSCGCLSRELSTTHGMEGTITYNTWAQMLARCNNPKSMNYKNYGAKGIKVCDRWRSFENFYADMGEKPKGQSIDRINVLKGYEPGNVRWATWKEQNRNQRNTKMLFWDGKLRPMAEIAEMNGLKRKKFENRIRAGMPIEEAIKNVRFNRWSRAEKAVS